MFGHETRPSHFFIPVVISIIGGIFTRIPNWEFLGIIIIGQSIAVTCWLIYSTVKDKELRIIEEEHAHYAEIMKLDGSKTKTKVVFDKTDLTGYMHQTFSELNIAPAKLKKFALGVLREGKKMTIREWTPLKKGKLFSDGEWRRLISFMKQPDWDDKRNKFIVPINPNNDQDGYELTAAGRKWLEDVLEEVNVTAL